MKTPQSALVWSLVVLPWTTALAWGGLALHVRLGLGHWPHPMWEQYSTPLARWLDLVSVWLLMGTGLSAFLATGALFQRVCWTEPHYRRKALVYLAGLAALVAVYVALGNTSFIEWWID